VTSRPPGAEQAQGPVGDGLVLVDRAYDALSRLRLLWLNRVCG
jgi:hypothetical protein